MKMAVSKGLCSSLLALTLAITMAGCATDAPPPPPPPPAPAGPPVALASVVSDSAAVYVDYITAMRAMNASFANGQSVQDKLLNSAAYEPEQLSRGVVAYAAIVAMQEPSFRSSLRAYASDEAARTELIRRIQSNTNYAASLPSADIAARRVILALSSDGQSIYNSGAGVKRAAYDVQRQSWSREIVADRDGRLNQAKQNSVTLRSVQSDQSARLLAAALTGSGLVTQATTGQSTGSYVIQGDGVTFTPDTTTADNQSALDSARTAVATAQTPTQTQTPVKTSATTPAATKASAKVATAGDFALPAASFASTTNLFDRPDLFDTPYTNAVNRGLTIAALAILGEGGDSHADFIGDLMEETDGKRCLDMSKLNLYQCLAVAKPYYEDVFCLGQHVLMDTGQCLGKMSSNALSFDPVRTISFEDHADAEPYIKPVPVKATKKKATATGSKKKRRH